MVNYNELQNLFKKQMDSLLSSSGLTTECRFNYGISKPNICPNCIYDVSLKRSSGKYKNDGPIPFVLGKLCPYCNGSGSYGEIKYEVGYLAVIWDYKKWLNPPPTIAISQGFIQTLSSKDYLPQIRQCQDMTVLYHKSNDNPTFQLYGEPEPIGLGDNIYLSTMWRKV